MSAVTIGLDAKTKDDFILTCEERELLRKLINRKRIPRDTDSYGELVQYLDPGIKVINTFELSTVAFSRSVFVHAMIKGMLHLDSGPQGWNQDDWHYVRKLNAGRGVADLVIAAARGYGSYPGRYFQDAPAVGRRKIADHIFGADAVERANAQITERLTGVGYAMKSRAKRIDGVTTSLMLFIGSADLKAVTDEKFFEFTQLLKDKGSRKYATSVSTGLVNLGILSKRFRYSRKNNRGPQAVPPDVDPQWLEWALKWRKFSLLSERTKVGIFSDLMIAGRWLKRFHPEINSPAGWTFELANEYVRFVDEMKVGELLEHSRPNLSMGSPLAPNSKISLLRGIRTLFRELRDTEHFRCKFNFDRAFAAPRQVHRSRQRLPRPIDDAFWLKLRAAAIGLKQSDLPSEGRFSNVYQYPLEMMQALAHVWVFSGCRSNEIERLQVGCVYLEHVPARKDRATGEESPAFDQYMLRVPVSKTKKEFIKPIEAPMALAILAWEKVRKPHMKMLDPTTRDLVDFLFCDRGKRVGPAIVNHSIIPMLLKKAGLPDSDTRGRITSHRARATMATNLYNSRAGLTPMEIMNWLGHSNFSSTQHYLELKPITLMKSFHSSVKMSETLRYISVLVDRFPEEGSPSFYYDLGNGLCGNPAFASCAHRMACAKCDFYKPGEEMQEQLQRQANRYVRMLQELELTEDERMAVSGDEAAVQNLLEKLAKVEVPSRASVRHYQPTEHSSVGSEPVKLAEFLKHSADGLLVPVPTESKPK